MEWVTAPGLGLGSAVAPAERVAAAAPGLGWDSAVAPAEWVAASALGLGLGWVLDLG